MSKVESTVAVPSSYSGVSDDARVWATLKRFEQALAQCSPELNGRQLFRTQRKGDSVFIEIVSTFKLKI